MNEYYGWSLEKCGVCARSCLRCGWINFEPTTLLLHPNCGAHSITSPIEFTSCIHWWDWWIERLSKARTCINSCEMVLGLFGLFFRFCFWIAAASLTKIYALLLRFFFFLQIQSQSLSLLKCLLFSLYVKLYNIFFLAYPKWRKRKKIELESTCLHAFRSIHVFLFLVCTGFFSFKIQFGLYYCSSVT